MGLLTRHVLVVDVSCQDTIEHRHEVDHHLRIKKVDQSRQGVLPRGASLNAQQGLEVFGDEELRTLDRVLELREALSGQPHDEQLEAFEVKSLHDCLRLLRLFRRY